MKKILLAALVAAVAHKKAKRADGVTPYVVHPLKVAMGVSAMTKDTNVIIAAILHDVVEDTDITDKKIRKIFGDTVADLVKEVTVPKRVKNKKKYVLAKVNKLSDGAKLIKLSDVIDNNRDLETAKWPDKKKEEYREYLTAVRRKLLSV
jgi:guanosine-3',5'-bis(diphosphate) 3'-pyrophosphohydrolase